MSLTLIFIALTVALSIYAWNNPHIMNKWIMNPYSVYRHKEYYRFLTAGFIHADYGHLLFNMLSLFFFGDVVEFYFARDFGGSTSIIYYAVVYLGGILAGGIPGFMDNKNNSYYNALGASGGVSAIVFSAILFKPTDQIYVYFFPMPGFIYAILYSAYSYYMSKRNLDNIGHSAHLWGAGFGVLFTLLLDHTLFMKCVNQILSWSL